MRSTGDSPLPPAWRIDGEGGARELVWRAPKPVPMGDARVEFRTGDRLPGVPKPAKDGRTFRLALGETRADRLTVLQVEAAGRRRLDAAADDTHRSGSRVARMPAQAPANGVDPGKPGSYRTVTGEYDLDPVRLPGLDTPVEMTAEVVAPKGATGSRPLALFLHGRHDTCYKPGSEDDVTGDWPCADGYKPTDSAAGRRGYGALPAEHVGDSAGRDTRVPCDLGDTDHAVLPVFRLRSPCPSARLPVEGGRRIGGAVSAAHGIGEIRQGKQGSP